jgi:hypothetical protein
MACKKNYLLISESERVYIKNLYNLLTEDEKEELGKKTLEAGSGFAKGKYSQMSEEGLNDLNADLEAAKDWIIQNKGSVIFIQIVASESRVTNYDNEQEPNMAVAPKVLSRLRAKTLKRYLKSYFKSLLDSGVINEMPVFQEPDLQIGGPEYIKGKSDPNDPKYVPFQSVRVDMKLMAPEKCLMDLEIEVKYVSTKNSAFPCRGGHTCNEAIFEIKLNGVKIGTANLNNENDGGDRTSGVIKINETMARQIIGVNAKKIVFSLRCLSGQECHSGTPEIIIKKNNEILYHSCSPAMSRSDQNEYQIHTLDACGNVIEKGTGDATNKDNTTPEQKSFGYTLTTSPNVWNDVLSVNYAFQRGDLIIKSKNPKIKEWTDEGWNGDAIVGPKGISFTDKNNNKKIMDVDPGTKISKIVYYKYKDKNTNPPPNFKVEGLMWNDQTSSGKYHVESEGDTKGNDWRLILVPGPNKFTLEDEKAKNIVRFDLDDESIEEFENYFLKNKLVEKTPDGMYKVIVNKITYASNPYPKNTLLKLN